MPVVRHVPGLVLVEHELQVPLDHAAPDGPQLTLFAREAADPEGRERPFLLYLEGGPGSEAPRPSRAPGSPGWLDRALQEFRVLFLDQRGTGRSTPIGTLPGMTAEEQSEYLAHFRADAIVRDAELLRAHLGSGPWSVLGQSFGGFTLLNYLSRAPEGLREALFTGGLPAIGPRIDEVYATTHALASERSRRYYERYPDDAQRFEQAVALAPTLASGDRLSAGRLRQLGDLLGSSDGPEQLHAILELPPGSPAFAHDVEAALGFARNPLYAVLQEACWADGGATRWAAQRTLSPEDPTGFTGEHVFPWMFEELGALRPLREAADLLAEREWPRLYDEAVLARNDVPAAAAIYADDLYVPRAFSEETAAAVRGLRPWVSTDHEHNGLRVDGAQVLGRLLDLARG